MGPTLSRPAIACRRMSVAAFLLAATVAASGSAYAQAAPAAPPGMMFSSDSGMVFNIIKPDKTADYEMVMGKLKEALQKSADPVRKQQAASWKIFKSVEPGPNGNVLYISLADPAVKNADYTVSKILAEVFPEEVQALYQKYSEAFVGGLSRTNLQLIQNFGGAAAPGAPAAPAMPAAPPQ